jgi:hypothetical protein
MRFRSGGFQGQELHHLNGWHIAAIPGGAVESSVRASGPRDTRFRERITAPSPSEYILPNMCDCHPAPGTITAQGDLPIGTYCLQVWDAINGNDYPVSAPGSATFTVEAAAVPEPATIIIWSLLGGLGLAVAHWRRRKAAWSLRESKTQGPSIAGGPFSLGRAPVGPRMPGPLFTPPGPLGRELVVC